MKLFFLILLFITSSLSVSAQIRDTISISAKNLETKLIKKGRHSYIVYFKDSVQAPSKNIQIVKINITDKIYNNNKAIAIEQSWERDTIIHSANTILKHSDLSTLYHEYFWKGNKSNIIYDFVNKNIIFNSKTADSIKVKTKENFIKSFKNYNLNWHSDLVILPLLPFKENRVFKINFYDPPSESMEVYYSVIGSDFLTSSLGKKIECWVLEFVVPKKYGGGYQHFWISKKNRELLKEEDLFGKIYRYKLKLNVSEKNM
ncbi:hypothetical protein [Psychroserpens algicola]|uniref:DUF3857 domain-containing protein n=1 Tax=Psychroserpens algicola TaxID=1719034 RepID=A0ABT0H610_9FLAO|nr:hypothetical protein [Psychroserpens algicola]MCK8479786.1 hypothetical protein [Psychroserpens algicola]